MSGSSQGGTHTSGGFALPEWFPRKWWVWAAAGAVLLLLLVMILVPVIASSSMVRGKVVAALNEKFHGTFAIDDLSLSWFGPSTIRGVTVVDTAGREVLKAERAEIGVGVWRLWRNPEALERIDVRAVHANVIIGPDWDISLIEALTPVKPDPNEPLPAIVADIHFEDVSLTIVGAGGDTLDVQNVQGDVTLDTLNHITAALAAEVQGGGTLSAEVEAHDLVKGNTFDLAGATITKMLVRTPEPIETGPLLAALTGTRDWEGKVQLAKLTGSPTNGEVVLNFMNVRSTKVDPGKVGAISVNVSGSYTLGDTVTAKLAFLGKPVDLETTFAMPREAFPPKMTTESLLAALVDGETEGLPELTFTAHGDVHLAELGKVFPNVFKHAAAERVRSNPLHVDHLVVKGGGRPTATGTVTLGGTDAGTLDTMTLVFDAAVVQGEGLRVTKATLASTYLTAKASGSSEDFEVKLSATDLAKLNEQLGRIFELGRLEMRGSADLTAKLAGKDDLTFALKGAAKDLFYRDTGGEVPMSVTAATADVSVAGTMDREDGRPVLLKLNDRTKLSATGFAFEQTGRRSLAASDADWAGAAEVRFAAVGNETQIARAVAPEPVTVALKGLRFQQGKRQIKAETAAVRTAATLEFVDGSPSKLSTGDAPALVALDGVLDLNAKGWIDLGSLAFDADVVVRRGTIEYVFAKITDLIGPYPYMARWRGSVPQAHSHIAWGGGSNDFVFTAGSADVAAPAFDRGALPTAQVKASWDEVRLAGDFGSLTVNGVDVTADVVRVTVAKGTPFTVGWSPFKLDGSAGVTDADLARLLPELARVLDRDKLPEVVAKLSYNAGFRADPAGIAFTGSGVVRDLRVPIGGGRYRIVSEGRLAKQAGFITVVNGKATQVRLAANDLNVPGVAVGSATGSYALDTGALNAEVNLTGTDLKTVGDWLNAFGKDWLAGYSGAASVENVDVTVTPVNANDPKQGMWVRSTGGKIALTKPMKDGRAITGRDVGVSWKQASLLLKPATPEPNKPDTLSAETFGIDWLLLDAGVVASGSARNLKGSLGAKPYAEGDLHVAADLPTTLAALRRVLEPGSIPDLDVRSGRLEWKPKLSSNGVTTRLANPKDTPGVITAFRIGTGAREFRDTKLVFDVSADVNPTAGAAAVNKLILNSTHLWASCKGTVTRDPRLARRYHFHNFGGTYRGDWNKLTLLIDQFVSGFSQNVALKGNTAGAFAIGGSITLVDTAKRPEAGPDYRYLTGNAEAGWDSAVIYGIPLGKAAFKPRIVGSQLELPPMQVTAGQGAEGKINLAGRVDLRNDPPRLVVGKLRAVDGLKITKDFKWPQMGEFFPFFGDMAGVTGIVSVNVDALDYPLGKDGLKKMTGRGSVEMVNFRVQPKGLFGILGKIAGIAQLAGGDIKEVPTTVAPFEIKDGRVYYENLTLWLGNDFDVRISGWVGFDDKIDMKATIPATLGLLKRVPTKNLRMRLNITGTRQAPRISVLGSLLPTGAGKKVGDGIGDALKGIGDLLDRDKKDDR